MEVLREISFIVEVLGTWGSTIVVEVLGIWGSNIIVLEVLGS